MEFEASNKNWFPSHDEGADAAPPQADRGMRPSSSTGSFKGAKSPTTANSSSSPRRAAHSAPLSLDERECWICKEGSSDDAPLYDGYCSCRGTLGFAHESCMSRWVFVQRKSECPSCGTPYECIEDNTSSNAAAATSTPARQPSLIGKIIFLSSRLALPLVVKIFCIVVAFLVQSILLPWIYGVAFYSGRFDSSSLIVVERDGSGGGNDGLTAVMFSGVAAACNSTIDISCGRTSSSNSSTLTMEMLQQLESSVNVMECVARVSFLGFSGVTGLWLCNTVHIFLYGIIVTAFFRMVVRGWGDWSRFITDTPLQPTAASDAVAYNQVQHAMQWLDGVLTFLAWTPGDAASKRSFFMSTLLEFCIVLSLTWFARSGQRLLALILMAFVVAVVLRLVHPPRRIVNKAHRFHEATAAKLNASALQVRLWFSTYILDIVAFSIILPIFGGYVVHYGGSGYLVEPEGLPRVVVGWFAAVAGGVVEIAAGDLSLLDGVATLGTGVMTIMQDVGWALWLVASGSSSTSELTAYVPGLLELTLHWLMGTICVITLVRYESLIILPLFAPGVDFFFIRAIDLTYQDEEETLCLSLVLTQVYDADPLRVVTDLLRLVFVECSALIAFIRFPVVATFTLFSLVFPESSAGLTLPLTFGTLNYGEPMVVSSNAEEDFTNSSFGYLYRYYYGDIAYSATLMHFFIFGCAVTSLATFPAQRIQLFVLRPILRALAKVMLLSKFLFEEERLAVLDDWLENQDADTLLMPYVPPEIMCVRRERRLPPNELPRFLQIRMIIYSICFLAVSTVLSWLPVVVFATGMLYFSHHTATIVCCSLALPFLVWSPKLFFFAVVQFIGVVGFCAVVPIIYMVNFCQAIYYSGASVDSLYQQTVEWTRQIRKRVKRRGDRD